MVGSEVLATSMIISRELFDTSTAIYCIIMERFRAEQTNHWND